MTDDKKFGDDRPAVMEEPAPAFATENGSLPVTEITPRRGWLGINYGELWHYRELLYFLIWRDLKARYKQTVIGAAWAVVRPVVTMIVFSMVFNKLAGISADGGVPYPIFVYAGLLPWTLFSEAVSQGGVSLIAQTSLITKVYFPRLYIPASSVGIAFVDFMISSAIYVLIMLYYQHFPGLSVLLVLPLVGLIIITAMGLGFFLSSLAIAYRDFRSVIPFLMQTWMYVSPVIYPASLITSFENRCLMSINPMYGIISAFRNVLLGQPVDWWSLGISAMVSFGLFLFGLYYFRRVERRFADVA